MTDSTTNLDESLRLLVAMAAAFETPHPRTGRREPLMFMRHGGGSELQHHAFVKNEWPHLDEEMLDRLASRGLIRLDFGGQHTDKVYVTEDGERLAA